MFDYSFAFDRLEYLLLLGLLPLLWWLSYRSLSGLGKWRRWLALGLRSLVLLILVLALADMQFRKKNDRLTVVYLLDQSLSIPEEHREAMVRFVNASIRTHRRDREQDRAGVVVFGRDAEVELPPVDFNYEMPRVESVVNRDYTNLAGALQRAMSLFPADAAKRVVVITDGNENIGSALRQARALADSGVSIDVLPVPLEPRGEASVDKIVVPADARRGQPFDVRVVLEYEPPKGSPSQTATGTLSIIRKSGDREENVAEGPVTLKPGKNVFPIKQTIERSDFYTYEARFTPESKSTDGSNQNNIATSFTHVRGKGHVLVIEDWEQRGEFDYLVDRLRKEELEVTLRPSNQLFNSLAELQRYDSVVLAGCPRSSGSNADNVSNFSDAQIRMLVRNTEELGCGLIMMGSPNSYGAGGWTDTELEKAMPVDFRIKSAKVTPVGALGMIMHASEIAKGNYWQKVIAREAIRALGPRDYCGLLQWNQSEQWMWGQSNGGMLPVGPNRNTMMARVDRMTVGDMPQFDPGMKMMAAAFARLKNPTPAIKHAIIISDGDPAPPTPATMQAFIKQGVKITTVAVGAHGPPGHQSMQKIAAQTGGKYYVVRNANALPKIYQREARRVALPLIKELSPPLAPKIVSDNEVLQGMEGVPPISGFVMTSVKESSLVNVLLRSPNPPTAENSAVLATWTYGLGKTAALTTDAGARWANAWTDWENYDRFFSQLVRWSMRPTGDTAGYSVATEVKDGKTRVIIDALDKDDQFINVQSMTATAIDPNLDSSPLIVEQTAPGRYIGEFDSEFPGSYLLVINPGPGQPVLRTGVNVGYSDEFRSRETNRPLLESLAGLTARDGKPGLVISDAGSQPLAGLTPGETTPPELLEADPYRRDLPPAVASQEIWPLLMVIGSCLFLADVFVRRVQFGLEWTKPAQEWITTRLLGRTATVEQPATLSRLQTRKKEVREGTRSSRFEADPEAEPTGDSPLEALQGQSNKKKPTGGSSPEIAEDKPPAEEGYTSRLLKAKQAARRKRDEE